MQLFKRNFQLSYKMLFQLPISVFSYHLADYKARYLGNKAIQHYIIHLSIYSCLFEQNFKLKFYSFIPSILKSLFFKGGGLLFPNENALHPSHGSPGFASAKLPRNHQVFLKGFCQQMLCRSGKIYCP